MALHAVQCMQEDIHEDFKNIDSSRPNFSRPSPAKLATNVSSFINCVSLNASNSYDALSFSNCVSLNCPRAHSGDVFPISLVSEKILIPSGDRTLGLVLLVETSSNFELPK